MIDRELRHSCATFFKWSFFYEYPEHWKGACDCSDMLQARGAIAMQLGMAKGSIDYYIDEHEIADDTVAETCADCFAAMHTPGEIFLNQYIDDDINDITMDTTDEELQSMIKKFWDDVYHVKIAQTRFHFGNEFLDEWVKSAISNTVIVPKPNNN